MALLLKYENRITFEVGTPNFMTLRLPPTQLQDIFYLPLTSY